MAKRQPDGRVRQTYEDPAAATIARRVRNKLYSDVRHDYYGFPLGIMFAMDAITVDEFAAGKAWAADTWRLAQMDGLMLPKCKAIDWNGQQGRRLQAEPSEGEIEAIGKLRRKVALMDGTIKAVGHGVLRIMTRLCIADDELSLPEKTMAKRALIDLAASRKARA